MNTKQISIEDFDYLLPDERIAKYPLPQRDQSKLLLYRSGNIGEEVFSSLPDLLPQGAILVRNNSKVIRARLLFQKESGAQIEIFCLDPLEPTSYEQSLQHHSSCSWHCLIGNAKRWKEGSTPLIRTLVIQGQQVRLCAERIASEAVHFYWDNPHFSFGDLLEAMGILPIPPYLGRETEEQDLTTYQTIYAESQGSVAAPTAGLHFTPELFDRLKTKEIPVLDITLHVGAGTFRPVKTETIGEHLMHRELIILSRATIEKLLLHHNQIIAVGTTSVRTLESLYHLGHKIAQGGSPITAPPEVAQWDPYTQDYETSVEEALQALLHYLDEQDTDQLIFPTSILIAPGYQFRLVRGMITNFHQPRSTLLLLISAFIGEDWRKVYDYALGNGFRFLSYGDSSLLLP